MPDVVEQARARAVAAFTYEALAAAPAGWTSPEFEGREAGFEQIVNAGAVMNRLRQFDWMREEINPAASTGVAAGNQAGASPRKESTSTRPKSFTGGMSGGGLSLESVTPRLAAIGPGQALDPDDLNLYAYMAGNPFAGTDPDGRGAIWDAAKKVAKGAFSIVSGETSAGDLARGAVDAGAKAVEATAEWIDQHPRVAAGLQMAQGAGEILGGAAATGTGVGAVPGALLMAHGADNFFTGVNSLISGKTQATLTQKLLEGASERLTGSKTLGTAATVGLDLYAGAASARYIGKAGGLLRASRAETLAEDSVSARLTERLGKWRSYSEGGGQMTMKEWVRHTKSQGWGHGNTGFQEASASWGSTHGNLLSSSGPHDVYAILHKETGQVLRFGETGRGHLTRFAEWRRSFSEIDINIQIRLLRTVEGKAAARSLETRYIETYEKLFGGLPPYQHSYH